MENYYFTQDLFDTFQSLPDWLKALLVIMLLAFLLAFSGQFMRCRLARMQAETGANGELVCTIRRDKFDRFHIYRHGPELEREFVVLLLGRPDSDRGEDQGPGSQPKQSEE